MSFFSPKTKIQQHVSDSSLVGSNSDRIFLLLLPREHPPEGDKELDAPSVNHMRKQIAEAERIMAALGGMRAKDNYQVSFEIVAHNGVISFYIVIPVSIVNYVFQQIRSSYPHAELEEVEDYNIFRPTGVLVGAYLKQRREGFFPIRTFQHFESDPFESLINMLSKIDKEESIAVQYVVKSAPGKWHHSSDAALEKIRKGESFYEHKHGLLPLITKELGAIIRETKQHSPSDEKRQDEDKPKRLSPKDEEMAKLIEEKNAKAGLEVNIRILAAGPNQHSIELHLNNLLNTFKQYNIYEYGNELISQKDKPSSIAADFVFRKFNSKYRMIFNTEELISLYHFPLPTTSTPNIRWLTSKKASTPVNLSAEGVTLGVNSYRNEERLVHIADADRMRHVYIIGTTGVGKTALLQHVALQDIEAGSGVGIIDPHGDFVEYLLENMPKERYEDIVLFEPSNMDYPIGLNMLEAKTPHEKDFVVQEMIQIFYKLVTDPSMIGPMFEHYMRNGMLTLMADSENPGTITEIPRIFTDDSFRKSLMPKVTDPVVRAFWEKEMAQTSGQSKSDMLGYLISKVGRFIENEMMRNIIGQPRSSINFKDILRNKKILLVNLSKGRIGEINSMLLGLVIVSKLQMAAFSQAELPERERKEFYLFIDEFQNYTTDSIAIILSEARKYKLALTMAHQYLGQLVKGADTSIKDAVLGNVGTIVSFRIGVEDAPVIAQTMAPVFSEYDLVNMEKFNAAVKMLVHNTVQRAFSMQTITPKQGDVQKAALLKELSARKYGRPRRLVEHEILERSQLGDVISKVKEGDIEASW